MKLDTLNQSEEARTDSTRTRLARSPALVPTNRICMTEDVSLIRLKDWNYSPICLVPYQNKLFYIVDGNHRFAAKQTQKVESVAAWILTEDDRVLIHGAPLPTLLREWQDGLLSYVRLCALARGRGVEIARRAPIAYIPPQIVVKPQPAPLQKRNSL